MSSCRPEPKHVLLSRSCIALVLRRTDAAGTVVADGRGIFADVLRQNAMCFWNACLARSVASLEYRGCLVPCTLIVAGTDFALEVVRSAWARRVLRPPNGYTITKLGDVGVLEMRPLSQTQFAPLSEALCKGVADLNGEGCPASAANIRAKLEDNFPEMQLPCDDILHKTLGALIKERKLYHNGDGYFIVSPSTYSQRAVSPLCERQMLMTNEEAIVKLHGCSSQKECSMAVQVDETDIAAAFKCTSTSIMQDTRDVSCQITQVPPSPDVQYLERSHSLKILRMRNRAKTNVGMERGGSFKEKKLLANDLSDSIAHLHKSEKQSMLAKLLKRMQSLTDKPSKHVAFSAQFPPMEWLHADQLHCHSVATQTFIHKIIPKPGIKKLDTEHPKIPWGDTELLEGRGMTHYFNSSGVPKPVLPKPDTKNAPVLMRQNGTRHSPSHRYSHGTFTGYAKRRHRHRRSSSESPKVHKTLTNGHRSPSSGSKSPTDFSSDAKVSLSSSGGSANNPKAIVIPRLRTLDSKAKTMDSKDFVTNAPKAPKQSQGDYLESKKTRDLTFYSKFPKPNAAALDSKKEDNQLIRNKIHYPTGQDSSLSNILSDAKSALSETCSVTSMSCNVRKQDNQVTKKKTCNPSVRGTEDISNILGDAKLALSETSSVASMSCNGVDTRPPILKSLIDMPAKPSPKATPTKDVVIDNSVSVEVALEKSPSPTSQKSNNVATTVVTEETTVTKGKGNSKVVTVTSITTSLSHGKIKDLDKLSPNKDASSDKEKLPVNDLNIETGKNSQIIDCCSSCNIVTEVK